MEATPSDSGVDFGDAAAVKVTTPQAVLQQLPDIGPPLVSAAKITSRFPH